MVAMLLLVAASALLAVAGAFNLNVKYASVFSDPEDQIGSYFGYTVSLLKESGPDGGSWLIVGAPKGNSTHPKLKSIASMGVVYQCKLSENKKTCKSLVLDSKGEKRVAQGNNYHDQMDHALLGSALEVQGVENGRIVVCAPRWKNKFYDPVSMNGICYYLNGSNGFNDDAGKLMPLLKRPQTINENGEEIFKYAYGGAGVSVNFIKNSTKVLIGAPGVFQWKGTIIRYEAGKQFGKPKPYGKPFIPNPNSTEILSNDVYFGSSVGSGNFFQSKEMLYVGGAPRASNLKGMALIFDFPENQEMSLIIKKTLEGLQIGEYFGSSLCVVDLNSDGLDDLVVGAPQHSLCTSSALHRAGDEGRIYVFISHKDGTITMDDTEIMGSWKQGARFGTSISSIGDLNNDGYPDIAVGAPYENAGHGAVYIYHGQHTGINPKYTQHITAKEISSSLLGFGISISRGSDVDGNKWLDLAVGAYKSENAVLLKSHPIITFHAYIKTNVRRMNLNATDFNATYCISYTGKDVPNSLVAVITPVVDPSYGRAEFVLTSGNKRSYDYTVILSHEKDECTEIMVNITAKDHDFTKPIELKMKYSLLHSGDIQSSNRKKRANGGFCKLCPLVDPSAPSYISFEVPYVIGCGPDDTCRTDLIVKFELVDVKLPFDIGSAKTVKMKGVVENRGDPAYLSELNIIFPRVISLRQVPQNCKESSFFTNFFDGTNINCELGNPMPVNRTWDLELEFDTSEIPTGTGSLFFNISSESTGTEMKVDDNFQEIKIPLRTVSDMSVSGKSSEDNFYLMKKNDSYSVKVISFSHLYEFCNFGPSPVRRVNLTFVIPVIAETSTGPVNLVKVYEPQANLDLVTFRCKANGFEFYSGESDASSGYYNITEERERFFDEKPTDIGDRSFPSMLYDEKTFYISCSLPGIQCMTVNCIIGPFRTPQTRAIVIFPFKTTPEVLEPVFENKDVISFSTSADVEILDYPKPMDSDKPKPDFADVKTYIKMKRESKIAAWILALAIIGGVLLLLLFIVVLVKLGFFKRHKKIELDNLKKDSEMQESLAENIVTD